MDESQRNQQITNRLPHIPTNPARNVDEAAAENISIDTMDVDLESEVVWENKHAQFLALLRSQDVTIQHILDTEFGERERYFLMRAADSSPNNPRHMIQQEGSRKYKASLADGGQFSGWKDNLATKLTLAHFGFPVKPITMCNILYRRADPEQDDPEDDWELSGIPYFNFVDAGEKNPLKFLDAYNERRHAEPPQDLPLIQYRTEDSSGTSAVNTTSQADESPELSMRGGGETETTLFGYTGKLHITGAKESFRQAALRLVYRDRESNISGDWEFAVDIRDSDSTDNTAVRTVTVTRTKFNETFKEISQHFADKLFIRGTGQPISTSLEPRKASSIVNLCLHQSPDVAYWIVPDDLRPIYGINQLQESFSAALRVLGFNKELQLGSVSIDGIAMGWAATDITTPLWNSIKQKIVAQDDGPVNLEVQVSPKINHALSGIRLVGTNDSEIFQAKELKTALEGQIYQNMLDIAERQFSASAIVAFKLQSCLRGKPRTVCFKKAPQEDAISSIKSLLKGLKKDDLLSPLIFWLTYDRFTVYDVDNPGLTVSWVTESSDVRETLEEFRLCLGKLWKDYDGNLDLAFCLVQPETDLRFYITGETTEQHWTENVLRWVQSPRLWVKRRGTCKYDVLPLIQAFEQEKKLPNDTLLEEQQIRPPDSATLAELPGDQVKTPVNKTIGDLQKESYTRLVSTVEPGFTPSVPVQSPPRENPVSTGLSPALYANQIAAAETTTTFSENFSLRNTVLNRISRCPVCGDGLDAAKPKDSEAHFQAHRDREVATGSGCPLCRDPRWSHMAAADQKAHIDQHYMSYVRDQLAKAPQGKQQTDITIQNTSTPNRISVTDAEFQRMSGEYHRARSLYQSRCPRCNIDLESMPLDMETEHVFACLKKLRPEKDTATSDPKPTSNKAPKSTTTTTTQKPSKPTSKDAIKSTANDKQTTKPGSRKQKPSDNDPTYKPSADGEEDESDDDAPLLQKIAMPFRVPRANDIPADTIVVSPRARAISTAGSGRKRKLDSNASSARKKKQI